MLRRPCVCGAGGAGTLFPLPLKGKWSAGRRQGVCETPLVDLRGPPERLRSVPPPLVKGAAPPRRSTAARPSSQIGQARHAIRTAPGPAIGASLDDAVQRTRRAKDKGGFGGGDKFFSSSFEIVMAGLVPAIPTRIAQPT